jgi:hypothetical protein
MRSVTIAIGTVGLAFWSAPVSGFPVTWEFAGEVTFVSDRSDFLGGAVTVGDPFSGSFTFESTTPDRDPKDPIFGIYLNALSSVSGEAGGVQFSGPLSGTGDILTVTTVINDHPTFHDTYGIRAFVDLLGAPVMFEWSFRARDGAIFSDDSLPVVPPDLALLDTARLELFSESAPFVGTIGGDITLLVPEPGTLCLLTLAAIMIAKGRIP